MTDHQQDQNIDHDGAPVHTEEPPQYGVGPFSIREVVLAAIWLVAFIVSFFPVYGEIGSGATVWSNGIDWVLTIGVPTAAVFLLVLRRLSPEGIRRVGSLSIDQFASVAFSVSAVLWLTTIWTSFLTLAENRVFLATWVVWVEFLLMLAGVLLTVFGPFIAPFEQDFRGRPEVPAHRNARPIRPVTKRPAPAPRPEPESADDDAAYAPAAVDESAAPDPYATASAVTFADAEPEPRADAVSAPVDDATAAYETPAWEPEHARDTFEPVETPSATVEPAAESPARHQAFWALVPEERDIVDEIGIPVFRIGPTAWALVIEDREEVFVVRHEDGRIGYLHDVSGVTRG